MAVERLPEDENWIASGGLSRRRVIAAGAYAAGFALACQPISAATIRTSDKGIVQTSATFEGAGDFAVPVFMARPENGKAAPIIVVVHEVFGLHEWIKDVCRRLAHAGYCAVAPDLFAREGDATKVADVKTLIDTIVSKTSDAQVLADIDAAYAWAGRNGGDGRRRGITGFCWGGRIVWLYAARSAELDAGVAFYGRLASDPAPLQPMQPLKLAAQLHAPVLGQYGGRDRGIPQADVEAMRERLKAAGKAPPSAITVYPRAGHGFMADYRPSYDEKAADQAWQATLAWFGKYVKG